MKQALKQLLQKAQTVTKYCLKAYKKKCHKPNAHKVNNHQVFQPTEQQQDLL